MESRPTRASARFETFALREHEAMQAKIDRAGEDIYRVETVLPVAIAVFYAWVLKDGEPRVLLAKWLYCIPPLLALLGGLRYLARARYIGVAEDYVRKLEDALYVGASGRHRLLGWENFYRDRLRWYRHQRIAFWCAIMFLTAAVAATRFLRPEWFSGR